MEPIDHIGFVAGREQRHQRRIGLADVFAFVEVGVPNHHDGHIGCGRDLNCTVGE